jgi:hypothetical protein
MSRHVTDEIRAAGIDCVDAINRGKPTSFLEAFDRLSAGYLRAMDWTTPEIADVRAVALRTFLTASKTYLPIDAAIAPRAMRWLLTPDPDNVGEVHLLWMQERMAKWSHGKRIYRLHPATTAALLTSIDLDTIIPGEVLRMLPHPDAFVWLPSPILSMAGDGDVPDSVYEVYCGFFINGTTDDKIGCHLDNPQATSVHVEFVGVVDLGNVIAPMSFRLSVPMDGYYSLESMAARNVETTDSFSDATVSEVAPLLTMAMAVLTYLASVGVEVSERRVPRKARRATGTASARQYDVGYRIGAALSLSHRSQLNHRAGHVTGRTVSPHIRRGHFHTYRHGPGKSLSMVKWLAPIAVNSTRDDSADVITIHGVGA